MARKHKCPECPKCLPQWLASFGDMMSLLLVFFVLLLSMSSIDAKKAEEAIGSLAGALSVLEGGLKTDINSEKRTQEVPLKTLDLNAELVNKLTGAVSDVNELLKSAGSPEAKVVEAEDGFILRLPANLLFESGSAKIENDDAILFLKRISLIVKRLPKDLNINAQGHTDDLNPSANSPFEDNWDLSTARAVSVIKELMKNEVEPKRLIASGRSMYDPITSNQTEEGRSQNRRVDLHFYSLDEKSKAEAKKSVLDKQGS